MRTPRTSILAAAALSLVTAAATAETPLDRAVALFEQRQYAESAALLAGVVAAEPGNARAHAYYGLALVNSKRDLDGGISHLEKAASLDPGSSRYQVWLGSVYVAKAGQSGLLKAASLAGKGKAAFEKAVALDPSSVEARQALLQYYIVAPGVAGGSVGKAREQAAAIGALDAHRGHLATARIAEHEEEWQAAEAAYREALKLQPDRGATFNSLGYLLLRGKRVDEALVAFRRYVELSPARPTPTTRWARGCWPPARSPRPRRATAGRSRSTPRSRRRCGAWPTASTVSAARARPRPSTDAISSSCRRAATPTSPASASPSLKRVDRWSGQRSGSG